jgi:site-specific recombinase XerD
LPAIVHAQGERASRRFIEFFTASIRNRNTRMAYARAVKQFFDWCDEHRLELHEIEAVTVAAYIEQLGNQASKPTVKQHLAAIRQLFDHWPKRARRNSYGPVLLFKVTRFHSLLPPMKALGEHGMR